MKRSAPSDSAPIVHFYRLIEQARPPRRADRSAAGTLPTRAFRYCHAVTSATGFGWWVFPPVDLSLLWDGTDIYWRCADLTDWHILQPAAQFPHQAARFDDAAPAALGGCSPPFLTVLPEPGLLQIWSGFMVRTAPGWSLLSRAPANLPTPGGYTLYEGIVETDRWFGPIFTNLRLSRTGTPIRLRADFPLMQLQPLPRGAYAEDTLAATTLVPGMEGFSSADWEDYYTSIVAPNEHPDRPFGAYAVAARKRRTDACPFAASSVA